MVSELNVLPILIFLALGYASGVTISSGYFVQLVGETVVKRCELGTRFLFWTAAILNIFILGVAPMLVVAMVILPFPEKLVSRGVPFGIGVALGILFASLVARVAFKYVVEIAKRVEKLERGPVNCSVKHFRMPW